MYSNTIGIWGFGAVGKSALIYFAKQGHKCTILDERKLSSGEVALITQYNATLLPQAEIDYFFANNDYILASPGIDINPHKDRARFICELDIFAHVWKKPLLAITGTIGKTSTTMLLGKLLQQHMSVAIGGNIGTPMLDLLAKQETSDYAILELSSWQLEHAQQIRPDIAIWTNLFPNHLDRHKTKEAYFHAKLQILLNQSVDQIAILPFSLYPQIAPLDLPSRKIWICDKDVFIMQDLPHHEQFLFIENNNIVLKNHISKYILGSMNTLSPSTYTQNILCAAAVLYELKLPFEILAQTTIAVEHRLEKVEKKNGILFYNDSKATVPESTLAAVTQLKDNNIILFLGGLSKGVDRSDLIRSLPSTIKKVICFGKEAEQLYRICLAQEFNSAAFATLEPAFAHAFEIAQPGDTILFSPAGSSYDLYANYEERGKRFKQLVAEYTT